ncbi:MAG: ATP-dependent helicase [Spirochaetes bacterium]|nr:ATP-dependent helicase [Spirochaetota bacterium]
MEFNKEQKIAIQPQEGIMLVIAGAGSGKTRCLVEKTAGIIRHNIASPDEILLLTFSRKAAEELKERIAHRIGHDAASIRAGTFHSFCYALIKEYYFLQQSDTHGDPKILDDEQKLQLLNAIISEKIEGFLGMPINAIVYLLEKWSSLPTLTKDRLRDVGMYDKIEQILQEYADYKSAHHMYDFHDLMMHAIAILQNDSHFRSLINNRFSYILVDEFQDTSEDNFELLNLLINPNKRNLFVVGDDWQSIYGFRNARVDYMIHMRRYFPTAKIVKLTVNYRSRKEIVTVSNQFISLNRFKTKKKLVSAKGKGGTVKGFLVNNKNEEIDLVQKLLTRHPKNVAILYRNNWQGALLKKNLYSVHDATFLTMHASKGLEFETIIIVGISDSIIPDPSSELEEERRLMYVALTRAKEQCYIIAYAKSDGSLPRFAKELRIPFRKFTEAF